MGSRKQCKRTSRSSFPRTEVPCLSRQRLYGFQLLGVLCVQRAVVSLEVARRRLYGKTCSRTRTGETTRSRSKRRRVQKKKKQRNALLRAAEVMQVFHRSRLIFFLALFSFHVACCMTCDSFVVSSASSFTRLLFFFLSCIVFRRLLYVTLTCADTRGFSYLPAAAN